MASRPLEPTVIGRLPLPAPTRIGTAPAAAGPVAPTALPGVRRKPVAIPADELRRRFPGESPGVLAEVRRQLATAVPGDGGPAAWAAYGEDSQRRAAALVSACTAAAGRAVLRTLPRHLARLQVLLDRLAESFRPGGLWRPGNPARAWEDIRPEVEQLMGILDRELPGIAAAQEENSRHSDDAHGLKVQLRAAGLGADILQETLPEPGREALAGRQASLLASTALVDQLAARLALDGLRLVALGDQVREGVLVRLPGLLDGLAALPARPTETQRFLLTERLFELYRFLKGKD